MATPTDFGWPQPKKKVTSTYGKSFRAKPPAQGFSGLSNGSAVSTSTVPQSAPRESTKIAQEFQPEKIESEIRVNTGAQNDGISTSPRIPRQNGVEVGRGLPVDTGNAKKRKLEQPRRAILEHRSREHAEVTEKPAPVGSLLPSPMAKSLKSPTGSKQQPVTIEVEQTRTLSRATVRDSPTTPKTPGSLKTFGQRSAIEKRKSPVRTAVAPNATSQTPRERPGRSAFSGKVEKTQSGAPREKRARLIDKLAAQAESGDDEDERPHIQSQPGTAPARATPEPTWPSTPPVVADTPRSRVSSRQISTVKKSGPKFTYGPQRTMLAEESVGSSGGLFDMIEESSSATALLTADSMLNPLSTGAAAVIDEGLEDDDLDIGAVRSIHELRQAGANSRFSDEMDDIFDRIGSPGAAPSSLRRGALLELAQKMPDANFRRQFRNHIVDRSLFKSLSRETETISGFAILAILVTLFATSKSPHLIKPLQSEGVSALLAQLMSVDSDVVALSKERKSNLSRNGQQSVASIKASLLKLPVWDPASLTHLTPRTLALKCIDLMMLQSSNVVSDEGPLSPPLLQLLFSLLADAKESAQLDYPAQQEAIDTFLALHLLESRSTTMLQADPMWSWGRHDVVVIADLLERILTQHTARYGEMEAVALRLVLNATNHAETPAYLVGRGLLRALVGSSSATFEQLSKSLQVDASDRVLDVAVFTLCVLINFCEHYPPALDRLQELGDAMTSPLDSLFGFFFKYQSRTGEADSVEKGHMNVAFGYLSVLLGYLCRSRALRERFSTFSAGKGLAPLRDAIREFIAIRRTTQQLAAKSNGGGAWSETNDTEQRLQGLVGELQRLAR